MSAAIHVLWNPSAGSAERAAELRRLLERRSDVLVLEPGSERAMRAAAMERGAREELTVVAAGGDGTVNTVARGLLDAGGRARFAVLPLGTGNDLSRTLAIPLDAEAALDVLARGRTIPLDVVRVRIGAVEAISVNMATGGMSARVVHELDAETKSRWGPFCYMRGALDHLLELQTFDARVRLDGGPAEEHTLLNVVLGNGRTSAGGLQVTPRANPSDGLLDVALVLDGPPIQLLELSARFLVGDYLASEQVIFRRARTVEIDSTPPMPFTVDGNAVAPGMARFEVLPGALRACVGPEFVATPEAELSARE